MVAVAVSCWLVCLLSCIAVAVVIVVAEPAARMAHGSCAQVAIMSDAASVFDGAVPTLPAGPAGFRLGTSQSTAARKCHKCKQAIVCGASEPPKHVIEMRAGGRDTFTGSTCARSVSISTTSKSCTRASHHYCLTNLQEPCTSGSMERQASMTDAVMQQHVNAFLGLEQGTGGDCRHY